MPLAHGASLITNFDSYTFGTDLAGQDGWTYSGAANGSGVSFVNESPFPPGGGRSGANAGQLGFQEIPGTTASVSHGLSVGINGASFSVTTLIQDSNNTFPTRDKFGFSLSGGGNELFGLYFTPTEQTASPNGVGTPRVDNVSWSNFSTGESAAIGTLTEGQYTTIQVLFTTISANSVQFALSSAGVPLLTTTINSTGIGNAVIDQFSVVWKLTDPSGDSEGSNSIYFDDLAIVPEPSAALLGLIGGAFIFRRRRSA